MGHKVPYIGFRVKDIGIVLLSDVHWGNNACDKDRFKKTIDYIMKTKNTYCILGGDIVEMVTRSQTGSMLLEQDITPTQQILDMVKIFKPLAKKGKIFGTIRDNHLQRTERDGLIDMNEIVAEHLEVPYWGVGGIIRFNICGAECQIAYQHGADAAANPFLALDRMKFVYPGCCVYALGHNHKLVAKKEVDIVVDDNGEESGFVYWQVRTGTYLKYAQYARERLFRPPMIGSPIVKMSLIDNRVSIDVDIKTLSWGL